MARIFKLNFLNSGNFNWHESKLQRVIPKSCVTFCNTIALAPRRPNTNIRVSFTKHKTLLVHFIPPWNHVSHAPCFLGHGNSHALVQLCLRWRRKRYIWWNTLNTKSVEIGVEILRAWYLSKLWWLYQQIPHNILTVCGDVSTTTNDTRCAVERDVVAHNWWWVWVLQERQRTQYQFTSDVGVHALQNRLNI